MLYLIPIETAAQMHGVLSTAVWMSISILFCVHDLLPQKHHYSSSCLRESYSVRCAFEDNSLPLNADSNKIRCDI